MSNIASGKDTASRTSKNDNTASTNVSHQFKRCWDYNVSEQFPITSISEEGNKAIVKVGQPHEGFYIKTAMRNGKMDGNSVIFSGAGIAVAYLSFVDGIASGPCKLNDESGVRFFEGRFEDGFRQGRGQEFDPKGNLEFDGFFEKGKKLKMYPLPEMDQYWTEYNDRGKLISITQRDYFGRKEGKCYFYNDREELSRVSEWKEGKEISDAGYCAFFDLPRKEWYRGYYENGKLLKTVPMKGKKKGYWKVFNEENKVIRICQRDENGKYEGINYIFQCGKISRISVWKEGKEKTLIKQFNGLTMTEYTDGYKSYEGGYLDSFELDYPRNGKGEEFLKDEKTLVYQGEYRDGRRHGQGVTYKKNKVKFQRNWIAGYTQQGVIITLCIIIILLFLAFLLDLILGTVLLVLCCVFLLIRWKFPKVLGLKLCNALNIQLMADYVREGNGRRKTETKGDKNKTKTENGSCNCFFANIYLSMIVYLLFIILCVAIISILYYTHINPYVSLFQTTFTVKSFHYNKVAGFKLSKRPFLQSIRIGNDCFASVSSVQIMGLSSLRSISIGSNSFTGKKNDYGSDRSKDIYINNCKVLQSIEIGEYSFSDYGGQFSLKGLPSLQSLLVGKVNSTSSNFYSVNTFTLQGILPLILSILLDLPNLQSVSLGDFAFCDTLTTVMDSKGVDRVVLR